MAGSPGGIRRAAKALKISPRKSKLTREEAVSITYRFLTTPSGRFIKEKRYDQKRVKGIVNATKVSVGALFAWSNEISFDWNKTSKINHEEAMAIRGLAVLTKLTSSQIES